MTNIDEKVISNVGLTPEQAKIYLFLLDNGLSNAKVISSKTGIGRALVYKVLDQLIDMGLVEERIDLGKISLFGAKHPNSLKIHLEKQKNEFEQSLEVFNKQYGLLASKYNALSGKPNIQFLEGVAGLQIMYDDILYEDKDIRLIRSLLDHKDEVITSLLRKHMKKQVSQGIKVKMIGPIREDLEIEETKKRDQERLVERRIITKNFLIPSQVIIYGNKVAITDFKGEVVTTVIENPDVRETFEKMFDFMFENGEKLY